MKKALTSNPMTPAHGRPGSLNAIGTQPDARTKPRWFRPAGIAAAVFGVATIVTGASTLFGPEVFRSTAGAIVYFVLWFNFVAGFAYLVGAYGLYFGRNWAMGAAITIAAATALVALAFTVYTIGGGEFAWRTPGALLLRVGFWAAVAWGLWLRSATRRNHGA